MLEGLLLEQENLLGKAVAGEFEGICGSDWRPTPGLVTAEFSELGFSHRGHSKDVRTGQECPMLGKRDLELLFLFRYHLVSW